MQIEKQRIQIYKRATVSPYADEIVMMLPLCCAFMPGKLSGS